MTLSVVKTETFLGSTSASSSRSSSSYEETSDESSSSSLSSSSFPLHVRWLCLLLLFLSLNDTAILVVDAYVFDSPAAEMIDSGITTTFNDESGSSSSAVGSGSDSSDSSGGGAGRHYKFALVPKLASSPFFNIAYQGCVDRAKQISNDQTHHDTVECIYVGNPNVTGEYIEPQINSMLELLDGKYYDNNMSTNSSTQLVGEIDGISIAIIDGLKTTPVYDKARSKGIPLITFDSDDPVLSGVFYGIVGTKEARVRKSWDLTRTV